MKRPKLVIDTNVMVSGLRSRRGASYRLLTLLDSGRFAFSVSVPLVVEYEKALTDPRMGIPLLREEVGEFIDYICTVAEKQEIHFLWRPRLHDPKDDMILELAVAGGCGFIVTFNLRDFAEVEEFGIQAVTPREFLEMLGERT